MRVSDGLPRGVSDIYAKVKPVGVKALLQVNSKGYGHVQYGREFELTEG